MYDSNNIVENNNNAEENQEESGSNVRQRQPTNNNRPRSAFHDYDMQSELYSLLGGEPDIGEFDGPPNWIDNDNDTWMHVEGAVLYMIYQLTTFFTLVSGAFTLIQIVSLISGKGMNLFMYPTTYFVALQIFILVYCAVYHYESVNVEPHFEDRLEYSRFWKHVPFAIACGLFILAYHNAIVGFYEKYLTITSGKKFNDEASIIFIFSVVYIFYFTLVLCINDSRRTIFINQIVQNALSTKLAITTSKYALNCALLLVIEQVHFWRFTLMFVGSIIGISILYTWLYRLLLSKINMKSGTKLTEIIWALLTSNVLIRSYLELGKPGSDSQISFIEFHGSIAFSISLSTTSRVEDHQVFHLHIKVRSNLENSIQEKSKGFDIIGGMSKTSRLDLPSF